MDELEQSLENLDELRREAKDYANTLVLPNDERLEAKVEKEVDRQTELLKQRDEQENKWKKEIEKAEELKNEQLYIRGSERNIKTDEQSLEEDRTIELLQMRDEQEASWKHDSEKSLIGKISRKLQEKLNGNTQRKQEILNSKFLEEVTEDTKKADLRLSQIELLKDIGKINDPEKDAESQILNLKQNELIENIPSATLEQIQDEDLLFKIEKENDTSRVLKPNQNGNVFSSILIILTTLTVGIIAVIMVIK